MAEERTEQATPRRREQARGRGETPRSVELAGAGALVGALIGLRIGWPHAVEEAARALRYFLATASSWDLTIPTITAIMRLTLDQLLNMALPLIAGACAAAVAVSLGQSGFLISAHPLSLQWSRLSLMLGLVRIFSRQGLFALLRSLCRLAALAALTFFFLRNRWEAVLALSEQPLPTACADLGALLWGLLIRAAGALSVIAVADYLYQRHEHERRLRMTRHEQKEEYKHTEGDPLVRSRIRERQRALARQRMIEAVKTATVVVTNPIEIAVALRYDPAKTPAPVVVAKGRRLLAERIRDEALRHSVPVTPSPDLARALYRWVPVGRQIPPELYRAVAEILAFVYRLTGRRPR